MKFSVLMSLYAREQAAFYAECLASLAAQTMPAAEIVVVYDGAIGAELEAVSNRFQAALPLKIVRLPENVGLGRALNEGLAHCSHEWIFRMDSDDVALPERFALQCAFIRQSPHIALLGGQIGEFSRSTGQVSGSRRVPLDHSAICRYARTRNPFNHMTVTYTRSALDAVGGYRHHLFMEDYNLWLRLLAAGFQAANLPQTLVLARTGAGMVARRRGWAYIRSEWQLCRLKQSLHFQAALPALYCFVLRALPRLLPAALLRRLYSVLRQA